jgi:prophage maintenance system killer protein
MIFPLVTISAVEPIHEEVLAAHGSMPGLRDRALLESAVAAPQATYAGKARSRRRDDSSAHQITRET